MFVDDGVLKAVRTGLSDAPTSTIEGVNGFDCCCRFARDELAGRVAKIVNAANDNVPAPLVLAA